MIRFIDVKTGNVYNGSKPYVHWFDGKQSVGLNYDKQFVILTEAKSVCIKINSEVFSLVDTHKIGFWYDEKGRPVEKEVYGKQYLNLDVLKTNYLYHPAFEGEGKPGDPDYKKPFEVLGEDGKYYHLYTFNIIAQGKYVGQVTDVFTINDEEFSIGADFYDENEILGINLSNFGMDLSNEIQRAIYKSNINEQKVDYVLLNRKFKELLNEYINIIGNKGSYKSLINSLKWFEYGELTRIYEYWKHSEPNKDYLSKKDLLQFIDESTQDLISSNAKTTYIGISTALNKILKENGSIVYENDTYSGGKIIGEPIPCIENISMLWSKKEMSLKMTLLHNFFATYFLPIHLDLIHSTIENVVYANTLKINHFNSLKRFDTHDNLFTLDCKVDKLFHLDNVETFTNLTTPFGYINDNELNNEDGEIDIIGVDLSFEEYTDAVDENKNPIEYTVSGKTYQYKRDSKGSLVTQDDVYKSYILQHYKGIGAIIPFDCTFQLGEGVLTEGTIVIYKDNEPILERDTTKVDHNNINGVTKMNFNILIKEKGEYKVQLSFRRSDGFVCTKTVDFVVDEENFPEIKMFKIVPKNNIKNNLEIKNWIQMEDGDIPLELGNIADYVLTPIQYKRRYYNGEEITDTPIIYTQFISSTTQNIRNTVHTNRVFILRVNEKTDLTDIVFYNREVEVANFEEIKGMIDPNTGYSPMLPNVVWINMNKSGYFIENSSLDAISTWSNPTDADTYYIGINTEFNIESTEYPVYTVKSPSDNDCKIWVRDMFIPYFYKLEELGKVSFIEKINKNLTDEDLFKIKHGPDTYIIDQTDVICFLPKLKCVRRPSDFMWKYYCSTVNKTIIPETFRRSDMEIISQKFGDEEILLQTTPNDNKNSYKVPSPAILQPLFGRYDFSVLPSLGYYDIIFSYKLDDNQLEDSTKTTSSQFIVSKKGAKKIVIPDIPKNFVEPDIPVQDELHIYLEEILRRTNAKYGFDPDFWEKKWDLT